MTLFRTKWDTNKKRNGNQYDYYEKLSSIKKAISQGKGKELEYVRKTDVEIQEEIQQFREQYPGRYNYHDPYVAPWKATGNYTDSEIDELVENPYGGIEWVRITPQEIMDREV